MILKINWFLRGLLLKPFFGEYRLPSYLGKPLFIGNFKRIFISKRVRIYPNSRMEVTDRKSSIIFKENISIGQNFHIISGGSENLVIGKNTTISANVFISNIEHNYQVIDKHIMSQAIKYKETRIGENCFIGYGSVLQAGTILGKQCVVGASSVVRGTFPDYSVIVGIPAKIIKRYNTVSKQWEKTNEKGDFLK